MNREADFMSRHESPDLTVRLNIIYLPPGISFFLVSGLNKKQI